MNSEKFAAARHFFRISCQINSHSSQTPAEYPRYLDVRATHCNFAASNNLNKKIVIGYGLVVNIDNVARIYSDDVTYNADSTMISCNGQIELAAYDNKPHDAYITAGIDSIGKPHLITCKAAIGSKKIILQFRQTYTISEYDSIEELPKKDEFSI